MSDFVQSVSIWSGVGIRWQLIAFRRSLDSFDMESMSPVRKCGVSMQPFNWFFATNSNQWLAPPSTNTRMVAKIDFKREHSKVKYHIESSNHCWSNLYSIAVGNVLLQMRSADSRRSMHTILPLVCRLKRSRNPIFWLNSLSPLRLSNLSLIFYKKTALCV